MKIIVSTKKIAWYSFAIAVTFIISSYVNGPPPATTNAPTETTCSTNGLCHGGTPNTGVGFAEIIIMGGVPVGGYIPGQTYSLMPYLITNDTNMVRSGFEVVARLQSNGNAAGNVTIINSVRTQMVPYNSRQYVEQTATGAVNPGLHDWMYDWTAPPAGSGTVIFYGAFVAGNGDGTSSGDYIYTDTLVLTENVNSVEEIEANNLISVYPNPATSNLNIVFSNKIRESISIAVFSVDGKMIMKKENILPALHNFSFTLAADQFSQGIYLVALQSADGTNVFSLKRFVKL